MFERYMGAKQEKPNKWVSLTITVSFVAHLLGGIALLIYSFWKIEKLPVKDTSVLYMAAQMTTPPPPPPPPPPPKKSSVKKTETKVKPTELVQPDKDQKKPEPEEESSDDEGVEGGVEGGVAGGVVGGEIGGELGGTLGGVVGSGGPPTPPPAAPPAVVAQQMLEGQRIAGTAKIQLSDPQTVMLSNQGVRKLQVKTKMCLNSGGIAKNVQFLKSSGYPDIDQRIQAEMMKWRYRPYVVSGKAIDVCFIVIFNYQIK